MNVLKPLTKVLVCSLFIGTFSSQATEFEIQPFFGVIYSSDLQSTEGDAELSVDNAMNYGIALSWQDSPNGQGQVMLNAVSHDFKSELDNEEYSLDIVYAHFNGMALFRQQDYVTTVSLGLGGAYFDSDFNQEFYPSASLAIGTRYEFSDNFALVTELRGYATLVDDEDQMFCEAEICHANFDDGLWLETNLLVGIALKF